MDDTAQNRKYFSERQGRGPKSEGLPHEKLRRLVISVFDHFESRGYLQEALGFECVDAGRIEGSLGHDVAAYFMRTIVRENVYPWSEPPPYGSVPAGWEPAPDNYESWDVDTLFDVIEVLYDLVSKPISGHHHDYNDCGWHWEKFDRPAGQREFRTEINKVLRLGDPPYEMDTSGEIIERGPEEFRMLLDAPVPAGTDQELITAKIDGAVRRFRSRGASQDDRRHAVIDLAGVLEALRSEVKLSMLSADEGALFQIANGFALRHHRRDQRRDYDRDVWLRWVFYVYLATIHAVLRVQAKQRD